MLMRHTILICCIASFTSQLAYAGPKTAAVVEQHLQAGTLSVGLTQLSAELKQNPKDANARFGLGALQFLSAIERLSKNFYRHGLLQQQRNFIVGLGIEFPTPVNPEPEKINYEQLRTIVQEFVTDLSKAEATLALINTEEVK